MQLTNGKQETSVFPLAQNNLGTEEPMPTNARHSFSGETDIKAVQREVYSAAKRYVAAGISIIPIATDQQKRPCFQLLPRRTDEKTGESKATWKRFQSRLPSRSELVAWFKPGRAEILCGIAIVTDSISANLEVIDFDNAVVGYAWYKQIKKAAPSLLQKLVLVQSPRPGLHVYLRCAAAGRSKKDAPTVAR